MLHGGNYILYRISEFTVVHNAVCDSHSAVGNSAGFIEAQDVYAGEHFKRVHILNRRIFSRKPYDADCQSESRQKEHSRGNHTYNDRSSAFYGFDKPYLSEFSADDVNRIAVRQKRGAVGKQHAYA